MTEQVTSYHPNSLGRVHSENQDEMSSSGVMRTNSHPRESRATRRNDKIVELRSEFKSLLNDDEDSVDKKNALERWFESATGSRHTHYGRGHSRSRRPKKHDKTNQKNKKRVDQSMHGRRLRAAFHRNPKEAVRKIIEDDFDRERFGIDLNEIDRFREKLTAAMGEPPNPPSWMASNSTDNENAATPITEHEVARVLRRLKTGSAPGPDGLTYEFWKDLDPDGKLLSKFFGVCRRMGWFPKQCRESRVIFVPKDRDGDILILDVNNWRAINLQPTISKIYASVIARRLISWASKKGISSEQKRKREFENVFMLESMVADSKSANRNIYVAYLDISNASEAIPHKVMFDILRDLGVCHDLIMAIKHLYTNNVLTVSTDNGETSPILLGKGLRQGCPLSATLLNLVEEVLARGVSGLRDAGYTFSFVDKVTVRVQRYADGICLSASSREQLQQLLDRCYEFFAWSGIKQSDCCVLAIEHSSGRMFVNPTPFRLGTSEVTILNQGDFWTYLGKSLGYRTSDKEKNGLWHKYCERLFHSPLTPGQKLHASKRYVIPEFHLQLRIPRFVQCDLRHLDEYILAQVKVTFRLPQNACQPFVYSAVTAGGLGIPNLISEAAEIRLNQAVTMINSANPSVRKIARGSLSLAVRKTYACAETTPVLAVKFLNSASSTECDSRVHVSADDLWTAVREAGRRLSVSWKVSQKSTYMLVIGPDSSANSTKLPHSWVKNRWLEEWAEWPRQGKTVRCHSKFSVSNRFMESFSVMTNVERTWLLKARLDLLPVRSAQESSPVTCRKCGGRSRETLAHVLNHCYPVMTNITNRHDAVLDTLLKYVPRNMFSRIDVNKVCREHYKLTKITQRPDLILRDRNKIEVIDVTCPFEESIAHMEKAVEAKHKKYKRLCDSLRTATSKRVEFHPFVIGSLGSYVSENAATLRALGISEQDSDLASREAVLAAQHGSYRVWQAWLKLPDKERS